MDEEIRAYYEKGEELGRLERGYWRLEFARTKELLLRYLPAPPAQVLDVGGGPGVYAEWLADAGYDVKLVDLAPLHVREARQRAAGRSSRRKATRAPWPSRTGRTPSSSCSGRSTTSLNAATVSEC